MAGDWVKVHRKILDSSVSSEDELLGLFTRILLSVNYRTKWFQGMEIKPGQFAFAWRKLPSRLYPNASNPPAINTIRSRLKLLGSIGVVDVKVHPSKRFSIMSVPNWQRYQDRTVSKSDTVVDTVSDTVADTERRRNKKVKENSSSQLRFDPTDYEFVEEMSRKVKDVLPRAKEPNLEQWANTIRLMRERDSLELSEIRTVFEWANADDFWSPNIACPSKLRKQFAKLHVLSVKERRDVNEPSPNAMRSGSDVLAENRRKREARHKQEAL
tara:strand:- start:17023 stop:17832 length:810 start_codon:yes stop_codon:yes gene_type:complete